MPGSRKPGSRAGAEAGDERETIAVPARWRRRPGQLDAGPFEADVASFGLYLAAENKAAGTIRTYTDAARWFAVAHLLRETEKTRWDQVETQDVQRWVAWLLGSYSEAYARQQYRSLGRLFRWLAAEDEVPDPMAGLRAPAVRDKPVPFFTSVELSELDKACAGNTFAQRRDAAILSVFRATGIRLAELAGIRWTTVTLAAATWTWTNGRSTSAGRAARTGWSGSITRPPAGSTGTCGSGPGTRRRTGPGCGWG
jgi:site-specific recombinase XerC